MRYHVLSWLLVCGVLASSGLAQQGQGTREPGTTPAKETSSPPAWAKALLERIDRLEQRLAAAEKNKAPQGREEALPDWAQQLILRVDRLEDQVEQLAAQTDEALRALRDLARRDGDRYYPQLLGKMQDPKFRQEVQRVVQGTLVINNLTGFTQPFYINGALWNVPPGRSELKVPIGTVYARLPWEPSSKSWNNWRVNNGRQELYLEIR